MNIQIFNQLLLLVAVLFTGTFAYNAKNEVKWSATSLQPHYHVDFNESAPYFEIRTLQPVKLNNDNSHQPLCVFDVIDIQWTYTRKVRHEDSLQYAALALTGPGQYEDMLTTPIGGLYQSLSISTSSSSKIQENENMMNNIEIVPSSGESMITSSSHDEMGNYENDQNDAPETAEQQEQTISEKSNVVIEKSPVSNRVPGLSSSSIDIDKIRSDGTIFCLSHDNMFCRPTTQGINLLQDIGILVVNFDQDTNMPPLESNDDIFKALDIVPAPTHEVIAEWRTPKQLLLQLNETDVANVVNAHHAGEVVRVLLKQSSVDRIIGLTGIKSVRASEAGKFHFFVVNSKTGEALSNVWQMNIDFCANDELLPSMTMTDSHKLLYDNLKNNTPVFRQTGIVAVAGKHPIVLGDSAFPMMTSGSWSLSFWIRLLEPPTGTYRSIFYKGNSDNTQRTPSAWLLPDSNKLTLRVSTVENNDAGITSNAEIPMNKWTLLTFVFQNETLSSEYSSHSRSNNHEESTMKKESDITTGQNIVYKQKKMLNETSPFKLSMYINGQMDLSAQFIQTVLSNDGSLRLFKDPSFFGPKSFVQGISLWPTAISKAHIQRMYGLGPSAVGTNAIDQTINVLQVASNPLLPYLSSIIDQTSSNLNPELVSTYKKQAILNNIQEGESETSFATVLSSNADNVIAKTMGVKDKQLKPMSKSILEMVVKKSKESIINCEPYDARLDMHLESAELGAIDGTYNWARLLMYGFESADSQCGFSAVSSDIKRKNAKKEVDRSQDGEGALLSEIEFNIDEIEPFARDSAKAIHGFVKAAEQGYVAGIVPLAFSLIHGIGLESLIQYERPLSSNWDIPETSFSVEGQSVADLHKSKLRSSIGSYLVKSMGDCHVSDNDGDTSILSTSNSVLCNRYYEQSALVRQDKLKSLSNSSSATSNANALALGLLFIAALHNDAEAQVALSYRYEQGLGGVAKDIETALLYLTNPTIVASDAFQAYGAQPIVETDRINDQTVRDLAKGHQGNDDEMIQYQIVRAKEGDVGAMLAMGDLYYYGARGLPRDQAQALNYYSQAANAGDPSGMCGAANMYLKGEGTTVNVSKAIELYESATANGSVRAYNGLGYLYFYGNQVEKNETKAFQYFLVAASFENDGDALFNTGYCLEHGIGVTADLSRAIHYYTLGAQKTGHFQSIKSMGLFTAEGKGVPRSAETALMYLNVAKSIGPWASWLRRGFDLFLTTTDKMYGNMDDVYMRSLFCYLYAGELGYEVAQSNAAYILRAKLSHLAGSPTGAPSLPPSSLHQKLLGNNDGTGPPSGVVSKGSTYSSSISLSQLQLREYAMSGMVHNYAESYFHLGNCFFTGKCGLFEKNYEKAIYYYHLASYTKNGLASAYLGVMYHFNIGVSDRNPESNMIRAGRYYEEALSSGNIDSIQLRTMVQMLQKMLSWKKSSTFSLFNPVHYSLDYVIKALWAA